MCPVLGRLVARSRIKVKARKFRVCEKNNEKGDQSEFQGRGNGEKKEVSNILKISKKQNRKVFFFFSFLSFLFCFFPFLRYPALAVVGVYTCTSYLYTTRSRYYASATAWPSLPTSRPLLSPFSRLLLLFVDIKSLPLMNSLVLYHMYISMCYRDIGAIHLA